MSEQADKPLHDWVRESLDTYRPDYNPDDWIALRRVLRRRRWTRWGLLLSGLLLLSFVGWLTIYLSMNAPAVKQTVAVTHPKEDHTHPITTRSSAKPLLNLSPVVKQAVSIPPITYQFTKAAVATPAFMVVPVQPKPTLTQLTEQIIQRQPVGFSPEETAITQQVLTNNFGTDSTSYQVLNRNLRRWPNAVIVCDFTTSMYPYSTQVFTWFKQHAQHPSVKGVVFFTDCDSLGRQTQPGGPPGQMFVTRESDPTKVLPTLLAAARNTVRNDDDAENDIEALLYAQKQFPEASHLILLADNISTVKDMNLLKNVKKPVHVILCGTTGSDTTLAYQSDYFTIASQTSGSLHTLEDDLSPTALTSSTTLRVGSRYFRYLPRKQRFKPTTFDHRPRRILKFIWF